MSISLFGFNIETKQIKTFVFLPAESSVSRGDCVDFCISPRGEIYYARALSEVCRLGPMGDKPRHRGVIRRR